MPTPPPRADRVPGVGFAFWASYGALQRVTRAESHLYHWIERENLRRERSKPYSAPIMGGRPLKIFDPPPIIGHLGTPPPIRVP